MLAIVFLLVGDKVVQLGMSKKIDEDLKVLFIYKDLILLVAVTYISFHCLLYYQSHKTLKSLNYETLFGGSPHAIFVIEKKSLKFLSVNESMSKLYGYTEKEFLTMTALDIRPEKEHSRIIAFLDEFGEVVRDSGKWIHQKKNGECFYVSITFHSIHLFNKDAYLVMVNDINQSILDEKRINDLLQLYETVNKATNDVIWDFDLRADHIHWMPGYTETYGYGKDVDQYTFWQMPKVYHEDREKTISFFRQLILDKQKSWFVEYRYVCAEGNVKYIADRGYVIFDENGDPIRMIGAMQDVTRQKEYEQQLLNQNEYLKEIAWINSHQVRRPLCNIMGLVDLIKNPDNDHQEILQFVELLSNSSKELDNAVIKLNKQTIDGEVVNLRNFIN